MAIHGKKQRTERQRATHYAKASRAKRHAARWDARVAVMRADLAAREEAARLAAALAELAANAAHVVA